MSDLLPSPGRTGVLDDILPEFDLEIMPGTPAIPLFSLSFSVGVLTQVLFSSLASSSAALSKLQNAKI